jgi:hypothetical protein
VKVISDAGIKHKPIENIRAAIIPSTVLSRFWICFVFINGLEL